MRRGLDMEESLKRSEAGPQRAGARVLVVDDDRDSADVLGELLVFGGHEVAVAYDGPAALARADAFEPDFVLLDLDLRSELNGQDVCHELLASSKRKPYMIAMTGALSVDRVQLRELGFDAHVRKPIDATRVLKLLSR